MRKFLGITLIAASIAAVLYVGIFRKGTREKITGSAAARAQVTFVELGPCTFAFMAPVLGIVFARAESDLAGAVCLLGAFAAGHCGVIVLAGMLTQQVESYLKWTQTHRALKWVRRTCGLLVVFAGAELLRRAAA
jgi:cytochrome c-type biogenesis protein